jgi:hypothetical protein
VLVLEKRKKVLRKVFKGQLKKYPLFLEGYLDLMVGKENKCE